MTNINDVPHNLDFEKGKIKRGKFLVLEEKNKQEKEAIKEQVREMKLAIC